MFLFFLFSSLLFTCNKDEISHEEWTEKDNIFQCKVNGVDWKPEGNGNGFSGGNLDIFYENFFNNGIQILASKDNDNVNQSIDMFIFVDGGVIGNYTILSNDPFLDYNCGKYFKDTLAENIIKITAIDTTHNIIQGDFKFSGVVETNTTCSSETIAITDGYFKAKYRN